MNQPFNKLTDAEAERLAILAEELAEAIKVIGKILRHGYESVDPTGKETGTNKEQLQVELGHVDAQSTLMMIRGDLDTDEFAAASSNRYLKITNPNCPYVHHQ